MLGRCTSAACGEDMCHGAAANPLGSSMCRDRLMPGIRSIAFGSFPPPSVLGIVVLACTSPFTHVGFLFPEEAAGMVVPSPAELVHLKAEPCSG